MEKPAGLGRRARVSIIIAAVVLWGALIIVGYDYYRNRDQMPNPSLPDISDQRQAGKITRMSGTAFLRTVLPDDFQRPGISEPPKSGDPAWTAAAQNMPFVLGTLFHVRPQGMVQVSTNGTWLFAMDGEGEFILEDARTDNAKTLHTTTWIVKKGMFRAKPHDYDPSDHWLQIRVADARVLLHKGEIGVRVSEGKGGQIWLMSGKATVYWKDGRQKELPLRGMEYL